MGAYYNPNELRASSSGFAWGRMIFTTYKTACLRKILVQSRGTESSINPKYTEIGAYNEERHERRLRDDGIHFIREQEFKTPVAGVPSITLSGHVDFVHLDDDGIATSLDELKSVSSPNSYRSIIKRGDYLIENLAQTVNYMVNVSVTKARLIYTYYEQKVQKDERIFHVVIDDFGRIHVDGEPTRFTVHDQLAHRYAAANAIATGDVAQRPHLWDAPFASPCGYCPFASMCNDWDTGVIEDKEIFVNKCKGVSK